MKRSAQPFPSGARTKAGSSRCPGTRARSGRRPPWTGCRDRAGRSDRRRSRPKSTEVLPHPLADRLQRLEARGPAGRMDAHALGRAVIDGHEHRDLPLGRPGGGQVGAPHRVDPVRDDGCRRGCADRAACRPAWGSTGRGRASGAAPGAWRWRTPFMQQPCPDLAMAFAVDGAVGQDGADPQEQCGIRHRPRPGRAAARDRTRPPIRALSGAVRDAGGRWRANTRQIRHTRASP